MQKVTRLALYCVGALIALLAVALLAVNLYVQSQGTQARIERELSERLGATVQIRRISVTPWWGLKLTGITMPQANETVPGNFLQADAFRLRVRFSSLFARRLVIKEISLVNPEVVWAQNADGKWRLPASFVAAPAPIVESTAEPPPARESAPSPPPAAVGVPADAASVPFKPEVRRVNLADGNFRFLNEKLEPVATFEGVRFRSNFRSATALSGNASIAKTSLRDRFFLEELRSPLSYDPTKLAFSAISAAAAGGEIRGRFTMRPADEGSPFDVLVKFRDLDADRIVADAHGPAGMVKGKLEGKLEAIGKTADPNALIGAGEIYLRNGQVRRYSLLVALGQLLQIQELMQLKLDQAHVKFHITPGVVTIDELLLTSPNLRLSATGTVDFAGQVKLEAQLAINERISKQLFSAVRENFKPIEVPGYTAVGFQVTGTVDHPKTNLMDKVVGEGLRDLSGVINSLLGRGRERPKKKKARVEEVAPAETAVPSEEPPEKMAPAEPEAMPEPTVSP
ncbi:MAG: AsmA-like C-terminal region-containing protein [Chthoniobacterales bacterium]